MRLAPWNVKPHVNGLLYTSVSRQDAPPSDRHRIGSLMTVLLTLLKSSVFKASARLVFLFFFCLLTTMRHKKKEKTQSFWCHRIPSPNSDATWNCLKRWAVIKYCRADIMTGKIKGRKQKKGQTNSRPIIPPPTPRPGPPPPNKRHQDTDRAMVSYNFAAVILCFNRKPGNIPERALRAPFWTPKKQKLQKSQNTYPYSELSDPGECGSSCW